VIVVESNGYGVMLYHHRGGVHAPTGPHGEGGGVTEKHS
jgi:hypothetical protein